MKNATETAELDALSENFREQAGKLVDMLDISIPVVAKLKVMAVDCHGHTELDTLLENFCEQAGKLLDMLDISIPVVAKLKVMVDY